VTIATFSPITTEIANITQANPGIVTTTVDHGYRTGFQVRIILQGHFGMQQLNGNLFTITVTGQTTFSLNTDTSGYDAFTLGTNKQVPQCQYVGEPALTLVGAFENSLTPIGG